MHKAVFNEDGGMGLGSHIEERCQLSSPISVQCVAKMPTSKIPHQGGTDAGNAIHSAILNYKKC